MPDYRNKKIVPINYSSRDFETIKNDLVDHAKRYYPDTFRDFSENSFGSLMMDTVAYVGDILSFYLDYNVNESFLSTAIEYDNVVKLGRQMGYRYRRNATATGLLSFFILVPASADGSEPDYSYAPILKKGSKFSNSAGTAYTLIQDVDFSAIGNETVVATQNSVTANPTNFVIKAYGAVVSGETVTVSHSVGSYQKFLRVDIDDNRLSYITNVTDSNGRKYHEVEHLSQNVIYNSVVNKNEDKSLVSNVMKPMVVPRRFVVEQNRTTTSLQFGYGSEESLSNNSVANPTDIILDVHGKDFISDRSFDPTNLVKNDKLGVVPTNTTLTITYVRNSSQSVNSAVNTVTNVEFADFVFENIGNLPASIVQTTRSSLECLNTEPILGDISLPSSQELKFRTYGSFSSQNRAVTLQDYQSLVYNMPTRFGSVKRVNVVRDADSNKRNLNIFTLSEDHNGKFIEPPTTLKNNIKTWLSSYKMINDTMDILDGRIVNIGIEFAAIADMNTNKFELLTAAKNNLIVEFNSKRYDLGEPFRVSDILTVLKNTDGLLDVTKVKIFRRSGGVYSTFFYSLEDNTTPDGRLIRIPEYAAFEIKFPDADITGTIR